MSQESQHIPVLLEEVIAHFKPKKGDLLLDATLGMGGHAKAFLEASHPTGTVVGFDADKSALQSAMENLHDFSGRVTYVNENFSNMKKALDERDIKQVTHVLFDLGIGSHQIADRERGFSFQSEGALKMKYGEQIQLPLADIESLNVLTHRLHKYPDADDILLGLSVDELAEILRVYGEERYARRIATALHANARTLRTAMELSDVVEGAAPRTKGHIHPATRTFLALRLAVNRELEVLQAALPQALDVLKPGGTIAVISFHSLEDRIVKHYFRQESKGCICPSEHPVCTCEHTPQLTVVTKRPIMASEVERKRNPRSRSAKLRIAIKKE